MDRLKNKHSAKRQLAIDNGLYTGRPANKNSKRQMGISMLNAHPDTKREFAIPRLMEKLNIGKSYAESIHATWRTQNKQNGKLVTIFTIKDIKNGKPVKPYVKKEYVRKAEESDSTSMIAAKRDYLERQRKNSEAVFNL